MSTIFLRDSTSILTNKYVDSETGEYEIVEDSNAAMIFFFLQFIYKFSPDSGPVILSLEARRNALREKIKVLEKGNGKKRKGSKESEQYRENIIKLKTDLEALDDLVGSDDVSTFSALVG